MDLGRLSSSTGPWFPSARLKFKDTISGSLKSGRACRGTDRMKVNLPVKETECMRGWPILSDDAGLAQNSAQYSNKLFVFIMIVFYHKQ